MSAWAAIAAQATIITGIYGMNFRHMPELGWIFGYPLAIVAKDVPVVYLPGPAPRSVSPLDFSHSDELIEASYEVARTFLASLTITGPGLYGSPAA